MRSKIAVAGIALCIGVMVGFNLAHRLSVTLFIVMPLICSAFIVAGWIEAKLRVRGEVHHIADQGEAGPDEVPHER